MLYLLPFSNNCQLSAIHLMIGSRVKNHSSFFPLSNEFDQNIVVIKHNVRIKVKGINIKTRENLKQKLIINKARLNTPNINIIIFKRSSSFDLFFTFSTSSIFLDLSHSFF